MLTQSVWYFWISVSSEGDELHYQLHLVQAFSLRLRLLKATSGIFEKRLCGPCKERAWVIFPAWCPHKDRRMEPTDSHQDHARGLLWPWCTAQPWVIALLPSMDKTSRSSQQRGCRQNPQRIRILQGNVQARILCFWGGKWCCWNGWWAKMLPLKKIIYRSEELNWFHSFHLNEEEHAVLQKCNNVPLEGVKLPRDINSMSEIWIMIRVWRLWN